MSMRRFLVPLALVLAPLAAPPTAKGQTLMTEGAMPALDGATAWLNTLPLTRESLRGKVVLVDFWTYSCINCLREMPYLRAWAEKYRPWGLVVIGVHSPEFDFEKSQTNIETAIDRYHIGFPVAVDSDRAIWSNFHNQYWPAAYFIDARGTIRHHHFGEGGYAESEHVIQALLREAGAANVPSTLVSIAANGDQAQGDQAQADWEEMESPETYIGYARARHFASPGGAVEDSPADYTLDTSRLDRNDWGLAGTWTIGGERAALGKAGGAIAFRFHARDLHLVLGPAADGRPVPFRVTIDGHPPGPDHGADIDAAGNGTVTGQRLYQLIRQSGRVADHIFRIEFLAPGVEAFSFTFG